MDLVFSVYCLGLGAAGPQLVVVAPVSVGMLAGPNNGSSCSIVLAMAVFGRAAVMEVTKMYVPVPTEFNHKSF